MKEIENERGLAVIIIQTFPSFYLYLRLLFLFSSFGKISTLSTKIEIKTIGQSPDMIPIGFIGTKGIKITQAGFDSQVVLQAKLAGQISGAGA